MKKIEKAGVATSLLNPFPMIEIKGTRIGAGSVVVKDIPSDSMAVGNPAKVIKSLKE